MASRRQRWANYIIDMVFSYLSAIILLVLAALVFTRMGKGHWLKSPVISAAFLVAGQLYYFVLEATTTRTLGKFITRTRVVMADGSTLTARAVLLRSLGRLVPLDTFSFLSAGQGLHDSISKTRVVRN